MAFQVGEADDVEDHIDALMVGRRHHRLREIRRPIIDDVMDEETARRREKLLEKRVVVAVLFRILLRRRSDLHRAVVTRAMSHKEVVVHGPQCRITADTTLKLKGGYDRRKSLWDPSPP